MGAQFVKYLCFALYLIVSPSLLSSNSAFALDSLETRSQNFNILLITIDALRADHLSCYGYERTTSPHIDKIAEEGFIFENVIAPSSWTAPSMVSLFTSVYPINHGVVHGFIKNGKTILNQEVFSHEIITLPEILKAHGYTTFGIAANLHLCEQFGFGRGFDYYKCLPWSPAPVVNKTLSSWRDTIKSSEKFFLWIHYFDPHHFYHARKPWIEDYSSRELTQTLNLSKKTVKQLTDSIPRFKEDHQALAHLIALYDSEINYVDYHMGELMQAFELEENTLIIITSDHGEEFLDHEMIGHGHNLYTESITVPLIIKLSHGSNKRVKNQHVSLLDIMPTVLSLAHIPSPEQTIGEPLISTTGEVNHMGKRLLFTELERGKDLNLKAVLTEDKKYIYDFSAKNRTFLARLKRAWEKDWRYLFNYKEVIESLFDTKQDPQEYINLINEQSSLGEALKKQLNRWIASSHRYPVAQSTITPSQETQEQLKALGYISQGDEESITPPPKECVSCKPAPYNNPQ
jgi:arylsulfatase A-like enzyme